MQPIYLSIQQEETGAQIRKLMMKNGYTVRDVQGAMGFENPQAIYKWISGKSLPSLDNFLILSRLLHASIEDILVVDGDIVMSALFETIEDAVSESGELAYVISLLKRVLLTASLDYNRTIERS